MNSFVLAVASIALVLVNMGIGWTLAKYHSRLRPQPPDLPLPGRPVNPELDAAVSTDFASSEEAAPWNDSEPEFPVLSSSDTDNPEALANAAPLDYS